MKKVMRYTWPLALSGLLISQISFAGYPSKDALANDCKYQSFRLNHIIESKPNDNCSGDVAVASAYLNAAETKIRHGHYEQALVSLHYSENELRGIAYSRAYCTQFASLVKPVIAAVIKITSELDVLERMTFKRFP